MDDTTPGPLVITAQHGTDAGAFAVTIRLTEGARTQGLVVRDALGSPIFTIGPTGGPVAWGDRVGASYEVFGPKLCIDGGISVPALSYLASSDLGNYATASHHWVCMSGAPADVLGDLRNNLGDYVACQPGDRYSRVDSPLVEGEREYICVEGGRPEAGETAGVWKGIL